MPIVYNYETFGEDLGCKFCIELVRLYPGCWDINIADKYNKGKRSAMLRFQDTCWVYVKMSTYDDRSISGDDISKDWPTLMNILKKRRYTDIYLTRIKEYIDQMLKINTFDKWQKSLKRSNNHGK